jgi:two-component system, chemotaxis family, response regulator Rcp1
LVKGPHSISLYRTKSHTQHDTATEFVAILLVEDNPGDVVLIRESLEEHKVNCHLFVADDGEKAIQFIDELGADGNPFPALVILDLNLPKRSGREVLRRMRQNMNWASTPAVILSSSGALKDQEETARLGASKYIRKPSNLEAFMEIGGVLKTMLG